MKTAAAISPHFSSLKGAIPLRLSMMLSENNQYMNFFPNLNLPQENGKLEILDIEKSAVEELKSVLGISAARLYIGSF